MILRAASLALFLFLAAAPAAIAQDDSDLLGAAGPTSTPTPTTQTPTTPPRRQSEDGVLDAANPTNQPIPTGQRPTTPPSSTTDDDLIGATTTPPSRNQTGQVDPAATRRQDERTLEEVVARERQQAAPPAPPAAVKSQIDAGINEIATTADRAGTDLLRLNERAKTDPTAANVEARRIAEESDESFKRTSERVVGGAAREVENVTSEMGGNRTRPDATPTTPTTTPSRTQPGSTTEAKPKNPWDSVADTPSSSSSSSSTPYYGGGYYGSSYGGNYGSPYGSSYGSPYGSSYGSPYGSSYGGYGNYGTGYGNDPYRSSYYGSGGYGASGYNDPSSMYSSYGYQPIGYAPNGMNMMGMPWWEQLLLKSVEGVAAGLKGLSERKANELKARTERLKAEYPEHRAYIENESRRAIEKSAFARVGSTGYDRRLDDLILGPARSGSGSSDSSSTSTSSGTSRPLDTSTRNAGNSVRTPVARLPRRTDPVSGEERVVIDMPLGADPVRPLR
jgi:hypothetical protein